MYFNEIFFVNSYRSIDVLSICFRIFVLFILSTSKYISNFFRVSVLTKIESYSTFMKTKTLNYSVYVVCWYSHIHKLFDLLSIHELPSLMICFIWKLWQFEITEAFVDFISSRRLISIDNLLLLKDLINAIQWIKLYRSSYSKIL